MLRKLLTSVVSTLLCALPMATAATRGSVWVVNAAGGVGVDSLTIQGGVDMATEGGTVLVKTGTYGSFTILAKSVSVIAELGADVTVQGGCSVRMLATDQRVHLRGLRLDGDPEQALLAKNNAGAVWVEKCELRGAAGPFVPPPGFQLDAWPGASLDTCASVVFAGCLLRGGDGAGVKDEDQQYHASDGGAGIWARASMLTIYDCTVSGGDGGDIMDTVTWPGGTGADACTLESGTLFASGSSFTGGKGGTGDFTIFGGCGAGGAGGDGLDVSPGPTMSSHIDCTFTGGAGGFAFSPCSPGAAGLPIRVGLGSDTSLPGAARVSTASSPHREGETIEFTFTGLPGDGVHVLYAYGFDAVSFFGITGPLLPSLLSLDYVTVGTIGPTGTLTFFVTAPVLPAALEGLSFFTQTLFVAAGPSFFLGSPTATTVLDVSF